MLTVSEVEKLTGVSVRTLHHYDAIGLLHPAQVTEAGYRWYGNEELMRLQEILLLRELEFPLADIASILASPNFDRKTALAQQAQLLRLKRERLDRLIRLADELQNSGGNTMDFSAFDTSKQDEYAAQAKERWGNTEAYKEHEQKTAKYSKGDWDAVNGRIMAHFVRFGDLMRAGEPENGEAAKQEAKCLRETITETSYNCTKEILASLSYMYEADGEFKQNIEAAGGAGSASYAANAIRSYCEDRAK